jgi:hypothetical protein
MQKLRQCKGKHGLGESGSHSTQRHKNWDVNCIICFNIKKVNHALWQQGWFFSSCALRVDFCFSQLRVPVFLISVTRCSTFHDAGTQFLNITWMLYAFFWVIPRHLNFICRRFGTLFHLCRQAGVKNDCVWECSGIYTGKGLARK